MSTFASGAAFPGGVPGIPLNAFVASTAPIQPPQAFVDAAVALLEITNQFQILLVGATDLELDLTGQSGMALVSPTLTTITSNDVQVTAAGDGGLARVDLPKLASLPGHLILTGNALAQGKVNFVALASVAGVLDLSLGLGTLTSINFPALASISGELNMSPSDNLVSASFPALTTLDGALRLTGASFTTVSLPLLATIGEGGDLEVGQSSGTQVFHSLSLPSLTTLAGSIGIDPAAFSSAEVDAFLNALAATVTSVAGSATAEIRINAQDPPAPPTSASAAARTYLTGLGINIVTD